MSRSRTTSEQPIYSGTVNGSHSSKKDEQRPLLYTICKDCPYPFPANPDYPIMLRQDASTSQAGVEDIADDDQYETEEDEEDAPPPSLKELYLQCLYHDDAPAASSKLASALSAQDYADTAPLQEIIVASLQALDEKWHRTVPAFIAQWQKDADSELAAQEGDIGGLSSHIGEAELAQLRTIWNERKGGDEQDGLTRRNGKGRESRLNDREWLGSLELNELQLQIVLVFHLLSLLPPPARRTAGTASHWLFEHSGMTPRKRRVSTALDEPHRTPSRHPAQTDKDKLYRRMAKLLDQLTDNLAIHQAISGIGADLADLLGDLSENKHKEGSKERDSVQTYWAEVIEAHFSDKVPSDLLSGCHSKFFNTSGSLTRSLEPNGLLDGGFEAAAIVTSSPAYHRTPNLRKLAQSVAQAQEEQMRNIVPASPTLLKLLEAEKQKERETSALIDDALDGGEEGPQESYDWLMPPPPPLQKASRGDLLGEPQRPMLLDRKRAVSSRRLGFQAREIEVGIVKKQAALKARAAELAGAAADDSSDGGKKIKPRPFTSTSSAQVLQLKKLEPEVQGQEAGRISKRKLASPKKTAPSANGRRASSGAPQEDRRTLVLATPGKIKVIKQAKPSRAKQFGRTIPIPTMPPEHDEHDTAFSGDDEHGHNGYSHASSNERSATFGEVDADMEYGSDEDVANFRVLAGETPRK